MKPQRVIVLNGARLEVWSSTHTRIVFPDGATIPASPQDDVAYQLTALEDGFGQDVARMARWHDFSHLMVAQTLHRERRAESPTLRAVADARLDELPHWLIAGEEAVARAFSAYCVRNESRPALASLVLAGADLEWLRECARHAMHEKPWNE